MEYTVNTFKDAITVSLDKLGYDVNNIDIIRKLITNALNGKSNYFTRTNGARDYINSKKIDDILKEMIDSAKITSNDKEEIIEKYIDKFFRKKDDIDLIKLIDEKSNLSKIRQKIRYINTSSLNDQEFMKTVWNNLSLIFIGKDNSITKEEIRYDLLKAALEVSKHERDEARVLKTIDITSNDLTKSDAVRLVEEYVYANKIEELMKAINRNASFSGLLLQNLIDYTYLKADQINNNINHTYEIDKFLEKFDNLTDRVKILGEIINGNSAIDIGIDKEDIILCLLKNSLLLNIYTKNRKTMDFYERKLYSGNDLLDEKTIQNRISKNNELVNDLLLNGMNTTLDDIQNFVINLNNIDFYFLINIYVISRSLKENINLLNNSIYNGNKEQIFILGILEDKKTKEKISNKQNVL